MSFAELKEALLTLSPEERAELREHLHALDEGISIEEYRAINAALDKKRTDPAARITPGGAKTKRPNWAERLARVPAVGRQLTQAETEALWREVRG